MTICESFYEGLDRRLSKKMPIDQIAEEMCRGVKDRRGKVIRIVREYKGPKFLVDNAEWLGYYASNVRDSTQECSDAQKNFSADSSTDITPWIVYRDDGSEYETRLPFLEDSIGKLKDANQGVYVHGWLPDDIVGTTIRHLCYIDPDIVDGYYHIMRTTFINTDPENENASDDSLKLKTGRTNYPVISWMVGMTLDLMLLPDFWYDQMQAFCRGEYEEPPVFPKSRKSRHPDWDWDCGLTERLKRPRFEESLKRPRFEELQWTD